GGRVRVGHGRHPWRGGWASLVQVTGSAGSLRRGENRAPGGGGGPARGAGWGGCPPFPPRPPPRPGRRPPGGPAGAPRGPRGGGGGGGGAGGRPPGRAARVAAPAVSLACSRRCRSASTAPR